MLHRSQQPTARTRWDDDSSGALPIVDAQEGENQLKKAQDQIQCEFNTLETVIEDYKASDLEVVKSGEDGAEKLRTWLSENGDEIKGADSSMTIPVDAEAKNLDGLLSTFSGTVVEDTYLFWLDLTQSYLTCLQITSELILAGEEKVKPPNFKLLWATERKELVLAGETAVKATNSKPWSPDEDNIIIEMMKSAGELKNTTVPERLYLTDHLPGRAYSAIRSHWNKKLFPRLQEDGTLLVQEKPVRKNVWTAEEDATLMEEKNRRAPVEKIAKKLPGRTVTAVQSRWQMISNNKTKGKENRGTRGANSRSSAAKANSEADQVDRATMDESNGKTIKKRPRLDYNSWFSPEHMQTLDEAKSTAKQAVTQTEHEEERLQQELEVVRQKKQSAKRKFEMIDDVMRRNNIAKAAVEAVSASKARAATDIAEAEGKVKAKKTAFDTATATAGASNKRLKVMMGERKTDMISLQRLTTLMTEHSANVTACDQARKEVKEAETAQKDAKKCAKEEVVELTTAAELAKKSCAEAMGRVEKAESRLTAA